MWITTPPFAWKRLSSCSLFLLPSVVGFSFSYSAPKSCDTFEIQWNGGTPPFNLLLTAPSASPVNLPIPDNAWDGSSGSYSTSLNMTAGSRFMITMSDATGFGAGGNSDILNVGSSSSGNQCNTTNPGSEISFQLEDGIQQCGQYTISNYSAAAQPAHVQGLIPSGSSFTINLPQGSSSYDWTVNIASGTTLLLFIRDNEGRLSTATPIQTVGGSENSTCLDANSPHSTLSTASGDPSSTLGTPSQTGTPGLSHKNTGAIIGGSVAGGVIFLLFILFLSFCLYRRRKEDPMKRYSRQRARKGQQGMRTVDLAAAPSTPNLQSSNQNRLPPLHFEPEPFLLGDGGRNPNNNVNGDVPLSPTSRSGRRSQSTDMNLPPLSPQSQGYGYGTGQLQHTRSPSHGTAVSGASTKPPLPSSSAAGPPVRRFVLHTDAGSIDNLTGGGTLELPPTYNAASGNLLEQDSPAPSNSTPSAGNAPHSDGPTDRSQTEGVPASEDSGQSQPEDRQLHLTVFNA